MPTQQFHELLGRAKVLGLDRREALSEDCRKCLAAADAEKRHLTVMELSKLCESSGMKAAAIEQLQAECSFLVNQAKAALLKEQPEIVQPGGALHPEERSKACWRDCWNFLRVITYAIAAGEPACTDPEGMAALRQLYAVMGVPISGLHLAIDQLQMLTVKQLRHGGHPAEADIADAAFQKLRAELNA